MASEIRDISNEWLEESKKKFNEVFEEGTTATKDEQLQACKELICSMHHMVEKCKVSKDSIKTALRNRTISPVDVSSAINEYSEEDHIVIFSGTEILDSLNGWTVDDEMAIRWGTIKLMERIDVDRGAVIAMEVLMQARECFLEEKREEVHRKFETSERAIAEEKASQLVCKFKNQWCVEVEKCTGTLEEFNTRKSNKNCGCYLDHCNKEIKCPKCENGVLSETFDGKLECDKCDYSQEAHTAFYTIQGEQNCPLNQGGNE